LLLAVVGMTLNLSGVTRRRGYVLIGAFIGVLVLKSGIHATLAELIVGFAIPLVPDVLSKEAIFEVAKELYRRDLTVG
jgi:Na+/H+ antiporter NhaA